MKFLILILFTLNVLSKTPISLRRLNQLSGDRSATSIQRSAWDRRYSKKSYIYGKSPAKFLAENFDYIAPESNILDMGMGEGRNAVFLATKGHKVTGIDISSVAVAKAKRLASEAGVKIKAIVASFDSYSIKKNSFDAIICFYYVDRKLIKKIVSWLKPGGVLIYEGHTLAQKVKRDHKRNPDSYYLKSRELLTMFPGLKLLKFEQPEHEKEFRSSVIYKKDKK
ncbi:MAG: class I SAM-dependent methyltransferase [Bacteriovoracaceae bacterium]|jgi:2-polyprenyl-3-methyl-5-hydroxy-6-metoxy-1,4-benzoquinol methylase|nr:class I SAM-dependent methyltransferase [Bacteriovoracaceae bacterium]